MHNVAKKVTRNIHVLFNLFAIDFDQRKHTVTQTMFELK